jgi:hypothetical protein
VPICVIFFLPPLTISNQGLGRLGAKMTEKPSQCTHMIARGISRTEKFLCALPKAPFIVTEAWATDSIKAGQLLSERRAPFFVGIDVKHP